ncbi:hypothetical protein P154DRAFT_571526 [Amniculicola lignicola CBS 123094]|uniref:Uncharacterized protein n=1 Tax=Amniculicola lignicola CBS 123094 TaxID=1392246 RepID=A0A6A5WU24_9PLEO|nr:hypothetical protein P154DRAFT_571526 [Amniculicola lignicola CBS 123094]
MAFVDRIIAMASPTSPAPSPFAPTYPYVFTRTYLCGHPLERIQVSSLTNKRLEHVVLSPKDRTQFLEPEFTLERCRLCATQQTRRSANIDIARNQGMTDRLEGGKGDGFLDVLNRYACTRSLRGREGSVGFVEHEAMEEDDPDDDDVYVVQANATGRQHYERALRSIGRSQAAEIASQLPDEMLEESQEDIVDSREEISENPAAVRRLNLPKLNTAYTSFPIRRDSIGYYGPFDASLRSKTFPLGPEASQQPNPILSPAFSYSQSPTPSGILSTGSISPLESLGPITGQTLVRTPTARSPEQVQQCLRKEALRWSVESVGSTGSGSSKETENSGGSAGSELVKLRRLFSTKRSPKSW